MRNEDELRYFAWRQQSLSAYDPLPDEERLNIFDCH
jgi:hypothetical protein